MIRFLKYNLVGVVNTGITLAVVWILSQFWANPYGVNIVGFVAGGLNSYGLNRYWTFKSKNPVKGEVLRFGVAFGVAWAVNMCALRLFIITGVAQSLSQFLSAWRVPGANEIFAANVLANGVYVVLFFVLARSFVYKTKGTFKNAL
jgi:putative flippase GtrA